MSKEKMPTNDELESLFIESDEIIDVNADCGQSFAEEYIGKNSGKSNQPTEILAQRFRERQHHYIAPLAKIIKLSPTVR